MYWQKQHWRYCFCLLWHRDVFFSFPSMKATIKGWTTIKISHQKFFLSKIWRSKAYKWSYITHWEAPVYVTWERCRCTSRENFPSTKNLYYIEIYSIVLNINWPCSVSSDVRHVHLTCIWKWSCSSSDKLRISKCLTSRKFCTTILPYITDVMAIWKNRQWPNSLVNRIFPMDSAGVGIFWGEGNELCQ